MNKDLLKRSLVRLGQAGAQDMPPVFIEHELAHAIGLFGIKKVLWRIVSHRFFVLRLKLNCRKEDIYDV